MKKLKSLISILLVTVLLISTCSMASFAFLPEEEFNIENITWDEIMNMSDIEFIELLTEFERIYDPLETYDSNPIMHGNNKDAQIESANTQTDIQPLWSSGDTDFEEGTIGESGCHELITARACGVLMNDKGFWGENKNGNILIALTLSLASILPDKDDESDSSIPFQGHFYNPDTGTSIFGSTTNTAKINVQKYYNIAHDDYLYHKEINIEAIGRMIHYIQDVCEPHHAANYAIPVHMSHYFFESYVNEDIILNNETNKRISLYIDSFTTVMNSDYTWACGMRADMLLHNAAVEAKEYIGTVDNSLNKSQWNNTAYTTTRNAVKYTALLLYKLSIASNIPLN